MAFMRSLIALAWVLLLPIVLTLIISKVLSSDAWKNLLQQAPLPSGAIEGINIVGPYAAYAAFAFVAASIFSTLSKIQSSVGKIAGRYLENAKNIVGEWRCDEVVTQEMNGQKITESYSGNFRL